MDPVTLAVLDNRLKAIVEEMGEAMLRTSYSQILNSSRDFSVALCGAAGELVAQADHIPVHVGALSFAVRAVLQQFPAPRDGDIFLLNDPYNGGSHLPDLTIILPVFAAGQRCFFTVVRAHVPDIGGSTHGGYNPGATDIWSEGVRLPPIRLGEEGGLRDDLLRMICANTRVPRDVRGDLMAMVGSARVGAARVAALLAQHGGPGLMAAVAAILDLSEAHARRIVAEWPDGTWHGEAVLDDDGHGREDIIIRATCTKLGSDLYVDLRGSDDEATGFVNSSYPNMASAVAMAFAYLLDADVSKNDGAFRPLRLSAREGSIVWAHEGKPVTLCTSHPGNEIVEAIMRAMQGCVPQRVMGGWGRRFRAAIQGRSPKGEKGGGKPFVWHLFHARPGGGGSAAGDGWNAVGEWHSAGGLKFGSIEQAEARFPLLFESHEFRPGSGGAGEFRGGTGAELRLRVECEGEARANTAGDGARHGSAGLNGGADSAPHHYVLRRADGTERLLRTKEVGIPVQPGDVFHLRSAGGGGWGDPARRAPEAQARDAAEGYA